MLSPSPRHILVLTPADRFAAQKPTSWFRLLHDRRGLSTAVCATGQGTNMLAFGSICSGWPSGTARCGRSRRSPTRQPIPMGGGGRGAAEVETVGVEEPMRVADLAAEADGEGLAGLAPAGAVTSDGPGGP